MAITAWADIKAISDSLGVQLDRLKTALGAAAETGSIRKAAYLNLGRVQTIAGLDAQAGADLLQGSIDHLTNVTASSTKSYELLEKDVKNLSRHIKDRGGSEANTWDLQAQAAAERYSPSFAELARGINESISAANVYPPVTALGTYSISGTAGTFTAGSEVDTSLYGGADGEVEVTHAIGGTNDLTLSLDIVDEDNIITTGSAVIPKSSPIGYKVNITVTTGKRILEITDCTHTGGSDEDAVVFQTKVDRTPVE